MKELENFTRYEKEFQNFTVMQSNSPSPLINHKTALYGKNPEALAREIRENYENVYEPKTRIK